MATRKKKEKVEAVVEAPKKKRAPAKKKAEVIMSADIAEMSNKPSGGWPKIQQGTHLTVRTWEDGHTDLIWDDEQLLKEVREAIASAELADMKPTVRAKVATRKKKEKTNG